MAGTKERHWATLVTETPTVLIINWLYHRCIDEEKQQH
jgi:hypothetical protein